MYQKDTKWYKNISPFLEEKGQNKIRGIFNKNTHFTYYYFNQCANIGV